VLRVTGQHGGVGLPCAATALLALSEPLTAVLRMTAAPAAVIEQIWGIEEAAFVLRCHPMQRSAAQVACNVDTRLFYVIGGGFEMLFEMTNVCSRVYCCCGGR
jgi:hypothetical protein